MFHFIRSNCGNCAGPLWHDPLTKSSTWLLAKRNLLILNAIQLKLLHCHIVHKRCEFGEIGYEETTAGRLRLMMPRSLPFSIWANAQMHAGMLWKHAAYGRMIAVNYYIFQDICALHSLIPWTFLLLIFRTYPANFISWLNKREWDLCRNNATHQSWSDQSVRFSYH